MTKNENKVKNQQANKTPSNNKNNSMSMKTFQTTRTNENPDQKVR